MENTSHPFDEKYFKEGPYADVDFGRYSQYWWSNRFYALLAKKHGPKQGRVLEIGCGLGHLLTWLVDRYEVYGSDINTWAIQKAQEMLPQGHFLPLSADDLCDLSDSTFQILIAKHVIEHLTDSDRAIAEMSRVLAPGGLLVLATPNLDSPMRDLKKERWIGYKDPTHINLKRPAEWLEALRRSGFHPKRVFSDGFWDAPYIPILPRPIQKILFGGPGGLQAILGWSIIPVRMGESLIVLANKV